jgi:elongation factor 1-beta
MDGLVWKTEFKKEPVAYGVSKLCIGCVIEDDKISTDDLTEQITEKYEEFVQSCDVAVFSKI